LGRIKSSAADTALLLPKAWQALRPWAESKALPLPPICFCRRRGRLYALGQNQKRCRCHRVASAEGVAGFTPFGQNQKRCRCHRIASAEGVAGFTPLGRIKSAAADTDLLLPKAWQALRPLGRIKSAAADTALLLPKAWQALRPWAESKALPLTPRYFCRRRGRLYALGQNQKRCR
jgi:hypothetical protein